MQEVHPDELGERGRDRVEQVARVAVLAACPAADGEPIDALRGSELVGAAALALPRVIDVRVIARRQGIRCREAQLEDPVLDDPQAEHGPAKGHVGADRRTHHVLDHVWQAGHLQHGARGSHEVGMLDPVLALAAPIRGLAGVGLAGRRSVDRVKAGDERRVEREAIRLDELERIVALRVNIDADDIEPGAMVAHSRTASAAVEIEKPGTHHATPSRSFAAVPARTGASLEATER